MFQCQECRKVIALEDIDCMSEIYGLECFKCGSTDIDLTV